MKFVKSAIHNSTSGFVEPGVGYLTERDGGNVPCLTMSAFDTLPNQGNSNDATCWITIKLVFINDVGLCVNLRKIRFLMRI